MTSTRVLSRRGAARRPSPYEEDPRRPRGVPAAMTDVLIEKNVGATMRDGTVLRADVYRPAGDGRYPVLVQRTPYNKEMWPLTAATLDPVRAAAAGFVVVIQDVRGRWASEGDRFSPYLNEARDGHDTAQWAASLPYANGRVGAYGVS